MLESTQLFKFPSVKMSMKILNRRVVQSYQSVMKMTFELTLESSNASQALRVIKVGHSRQKRRRLNKCLCREREKSRCLVDKR